MFNPRDPRHNPEISNFTWRRQDSSSSESPAPISWIQTLTRRSYHRARSGLLALRAEIIQRFSEDETPDRGFVDPAALWRERERYDIASVAYTSSTLEDPHFGSEIFRTSAKPSRPTVNSGPESLCDISSERSVSQSFATVPAIAKSRNLRPCGDSVSNGLKPTYILAQGSGMKCQVAGAGGLEADRNFNDHFAHTDPSTDQHLTHLPWSVPLSTRQETELYAHELAAPQSVRIEQQTTDSQDSNSSHISSITETSEDLSSSVPLSRQCSAEVRFAFPGIYQEMLEQWTRQRDSPSEDSPRSSQNFPNYSDHEETPCASRTVLQDDVHDLSSYHGHDETLIPLVGSCTPFPYSEEIQLFHHPNPLNSIFRQQLGSDGSSFSEWATTQGSSVEEYSNHHTHEDTTPRDITSTERTSMASMSNDTWSPIDSEVLFPSPAEEGNEYFLVDGKTSGLHLDRDNQPVKPTQHTTSYCNIPVQSSDTTNVISPRTFSLRLVSASHPGGGLEFMEEDTDDEFYPGVVQPRHFDRGEAW